MCDTFIVQGRLMESGRTTLAKNSDREPNEAQYLETFAAADHAPGATLRCTYIEIPQVAHTYAMIGSRPWWMWGFEHGVNEHGLAIGNEAVWSKVPASTEPGLLGMDLLRLTLERAKSADEGLAVLTGLLERYGQSGATSALRAQSYHNSFIIADADGGWNLQTAGRHWAARRIDGWDAISNIYSIGADYDRISAGAIDHATRQGWFDPEAGKPFDFAAAFADITLAFLPGCAARLACAQTGLAALEKERKVVLEDVFALLRSHGAEAQPDDWRPPADGEALICMHAGRPEHSETAAAMVAELPKAKLHESPYLLWVALASPCLSSFVPVWQDSGQPEGWTQPPSGANRDAWWTMEAMQRGIEQDYGRLAKAPRAMLAALEAETLAAVRALAPNAGRADRNALTQSIARRQEAACRIIDAMTKAFAADVVPPRADDPRGSYLAAVEAERVAMMRGDFGDQAPLKRAAPGVPAR
ncbi:MAG TPA: C69 family dipeptidase [Dongiaceae bacterium]|nr:C69 family dipeptidase [Dongiaceae bacterium]